MAGSDPIAVVDRKDLSPGAFDLAAVTEAVQQDLKDFRRALKEDGFVVDVDRGPSDEVVAGYVSNVRAYLYNESRHMKEVVVEATAGVGTRAQITDWLQKLSLNDGVFDLSIATHPRAAVREAVFDFAVGNEIGNLMMIVPPSAEESVSPSGLLSRFVGRILPLQEWQAAAQVVNRTRKGISRVFSRGLHHNDPHQRGPGPDARLAAWSTVGPSSRAIAAGISAQIVSISRR